MHKRRRSSTLTPRHLKRLSAVILHGLFIGLFIAGFLARYIHPGYIWWFQLVAIGLPFLSVLVLAVLLIVIISRKWRLASIYMVLALLIGIRFVPGLSFSKSRSGSEELLSVMSFNFTYDFGSARIRNNGELVMIDPIERPHIVALQEAILRFRNQDDRLQFPAPLSVLIDSLGYTTKKPDELPYGRYVQPVLSRLNMRNVTQIPLQYGVRDGVPEFVSRTEIEWNETVIVVYNLHLHSFNKYRRFGRTEWLNPFAWPELYRIYRDDFVTRAGQAMEVRRMLDSENGPLILCGDFNSTPHNWVYRRIKGNLIDTLEKRGRFWNGTYPEKVPLVRIDHLLVSSNFRVDRAEISRSNFSDHRPLFVSLSLRE